VLEPVESAQDLFEVAEDLPEPTVDLHELTLDERNQLVELAARHARLLHERRTVIQECKMSDGRA
jgi:hypothetical protein